MEMRIELSAEKFRPSTAIVARFDIFGIYPGNLRNYARSDPLYSTEEARNLK